MRWLYAASFGPVQSFIAAARKTRDLFRGSELLSQVARNAARAVARHGGTLIFPAPELAREEQVPLPNHVLAVVARDPGTVHREVEEEAQDTVLSALGAARERLRRLGLAEWVDWDLAEQQVRDLLEVYGAWLPWPEDSPVGYAEARRDLERLLAGRKSLRDFSPPPGRGRYKSLLDGGGESVLRKPPDHPVWAPALLESGEWLDGPGIMKRFSDDRQFVSTARVAADPLVRGLAEEDRRELVRLVQTLPGELAVPLPRDLRPYAAFPWDGEMFFAGGQLEAKKVGAGEKVAEFRRSLARALRFRGPGELDRWAYLGVLVADGDRMGEAIDRLGSMEEHQQFSRRGARFTREVGGAIAAEGGSLVYSGGDDVLALLPADRAVSAACRVRELFQRSWGDRLTLSVGVLLGHYKEPLQVLVEGAREMLRRAKEKRGALAVGYRAASGSGPGAVVQTFRPGLNDLWDEVARMYRSEALPDRLSYALAALQRELGNDGMHELDDAIRHEVRRILRRRRAERGRRPLTSEELRRVDELIFGSGPDAVSSLETAVPFLGLTRRLAGWHVGTGERRP